MRKIHQVGRRIMAMAVMLGASIAAHGQQPQVSIHMQKFFDVVYYVENMYVDNVKEKNLIEDAITGMLKELDPHSTFVPADEVEMANAPMEGNFEGIGVTFNMVEDTLMVVQTIAGGPAEKVGIVPGDRFVYVNDTLIAGVKMKNTDLIKRIRGKKGTMVEVKVLRRGMGKDLMTFRIKRDKIPLYSLDAAYMLTDETGYVKLNRFSATTQKEFGDALNKLIGQGMKNLILDLKGNGGGYLSAAIRIADELLPKGQLVTYTEGRNSPRKEDMTNSTGKFENGRLCILIDENTASASEIVTGAVQDWDRGLVIGRRSYGKGLVQRPIRLRDGSEIRLTIARYYTPSGRCIQRPYEDGVDEYKKEWEKRLNHGELQHADSIALPDSLKKETRIARRIVYGGGGIMPDFFVPLDTTKYTKFHREVVGKGVMLRVVAQIIEKDRGNILKRYKTFEDYRTGYEVSRETLDRVAEYAAKEKIALPEDLDKELYGNDEIKRQIKAWVARDLWDTEAYTRLIGEQDETIRKALEVIENETVYRAALTREGQKIGSAAPVAEEKAPGAASPGNVKKKKK